MNENELKYCEYFNVNEKYFPCIDESAIHDGVDWRETYPHETFIDLLDKTEKMLGGSTKSSLWIHGAYGTGKSRCAYALKMILDAPEEEVEEYWGRYKALKKNKHLMKKLLGHKKQGVITAFRYASGSITSPQQLFFAVQESIRDALNEIPGSYKGMNTLKESVISWLEDPYHKNVLNSLLEKPEWMAVFSQSNADEIINSLKKNSDVSDLMDNLFRMGAKDGVRAFSFTSDSLCDWIRDVVNGNHTKIVLIWDEFSAYFRQNKNSLDEFQKIVSLCQETHFYFVIVTHPITSLTGGAVTKDDPMSVVQQRFEKVEIKLPSNIAFELTGHAFSVIPTAREKWEAMTDDLDGRVPYAKAAVMKETEVKDESIMKNMLPIHPMAALALKNIASAFQSDQRSMFNFIKTSSELDVHAFQWFIQNTSPSSDRPLLTIDMLWDFFYVKGKDYLTPDIKVILDIFPQQTDLLEKEQVVLKTILIMQALDQRLGGTVPLLKPTDQTLTYAFEGDWDEYAVECKGIASGLVEKNVLIKIPMTDGKQMYSTAIKAGDSAQIEKYKEEIRKGTDTAKLVDVGSQLACALSLPPALRLRYATDVTTGALPVVTSANFQKIMDSLKDKDVGWHFYAVLALAKTEEEAQAFRLQIKKAIVNKEYENIAVIDALSSPLGLDDFEKYVDFSAMSQYYSGNNNQEAKNNDSKAKDVLEHTWKDRIYNGPFTVWTYASQYGDNTVGATGVHTILQTIVLTRYKYIPDFTKGLTETQLKPTQQKQVALIGMGASEMKGLISGCEKSVLGSVWNKENYWEDPNLENDSVSVVKRTVDKEIKDAFQKSGRISMDDIYHNILESEFGYSPCSVTAFVTGFLLKEYSQDPYRSQDAEGHGEPMTPEKLAEMIANCMSGKGKTTYIVSMTPEEKAFYDLTGAVWGIESNSCASAAQAGALIQKKMQSFGFPVWTLAEVDQTGCYDLVQKYMDLVQSDGKEAHNIAVSIGKIAEQQPSCRQHLIDLLTADNCQKGMAIFLEHFDNGALPALAKEIGAEGHMLGDVKQLFSVEYAAQWKQSVGEDEIRKLATEYEFVKATNALLHVSTSSKNGAIQSWRDTLKFAGFSCEAMQAKRPNLAALFSLLRKIANSEDLLPDNLRQLLQELSDHNTEMQDIWSDLDAVFMEIYSDYLEGFTPTECAGIKNSIQDNIFLLSHTQSNETVKKAAEDYRNHQVKTQLFNLWGSKTNGTKNPRHWSEMHKTPILCCVPAEEYSAAKKAFDTLNSNLQTDAEIKSALAFLEHATFLDKLEDPTFRDDCFRRRIVGDYQNLLPDLAAIRTKLSVLQVPPYDWIDDPSVQETIKKMASTEYYAGGSDNAMKTVDDMTETELRNWLKQMISQDMDLGMKILHQGRQ